MFRRSGISPISMGYDSKGTRSRAHSPRFGINPASDVSERVQQNKEPDADRRSQHRRQNQHKKRLSSHYTQPRTLTAGLLGRLNIVPCAFPKRFGPQPRRVHAQSLRG